MTLLDDPQVLPINPIERRVRGMDAMRRLVAQVLTGSPSDPQAGITDEKWFALCAHARGAKDEKTAIARVIKEAYRLRTDAPTVPAAPIPEAYPPASVVTVEPIPSIAPAAQEFYRETPELPIPAGFGTPRPGVVGLLGPVADPSREDLRPRPLHRADRGEGQRARRTVLWRRRPPSTATGLVTEDNRERWLTIASWVRNVGLIILLFVAWQLWGTAISQHHSQADLSNQFHAHLAHPATKPPAAFSLAPATTKIGDPPEGSVMAQLQIPKIGLDQYVVSGTAEGDLAKGPGHYLGTAMPGQSGNVAIAGHRTTHGAPFNRLAELVVGSRIYLTTSGGEVLTYVVAATPYPVSPTNVSVLNNFGDNRLTLTTCNPEFSAAQRLIVVAAYLPPGASHPAPIVTGSGKPYKLAAVSTGWNMSQLPLVLAAVGGLILLGLFFRRLSSIYGRQARWLILVPVWLALLLVLFDGLTNLLPSSV
jgi:sortase A